MDLTDEVKYTLIGDIYSSMEGGIVWIRFKAISHLLLMVLAFLAKKIVLMYAIVGTLWQVTAHGYYCGLVR